MRWTIAFLALAAAASAMAQTLPEQPALQTREQLQSILRSQPPQLGRVLRLDPTLLSNEPYMTNYPSVSAFAKQHPEIQHNPSYFLGMPDDDIEGGYRVWREIGGDIAGFTVFVIVTLVLVWMVRTLIEQRRWSRLSAIQTEVHSKLLDRFTTNEELLAYLQTSAGRKFLESAPIPVGAGAQPVAAPIGRIFWSLQIGLVLVAAGIGFSFVANPGAREMYAIGIITTLIGIALMLSAGVFYLLGKRFGLWQPTVS